MNARLDLKTFAFLNPMFSSSLENPFSMAISRACVGFQRNNFRNVVFLEPGRMLENNRSICGSIEGENAIFLELMKSKILLLISNYILRSENFKVDNFSINYIISELKQINAYIQDE